MDRVLIVVGMAAVTYATRFAMIAALGWRDALLDEARGPTLLSRWLRFVPPAVLSALIVPPVVAPRGRLALGTPLWATLAGAAVAWRTRSPLWTIVSGMAVLWALRALGP